MNQKIIIYSMIVFISTLFIFDILVSPYKIKEIDILLQNKLKIVPVSKGNKLVYGKVTLDKDGVFPFWTSEYRGPYFNYSKKKKLNCRVLGLGDSIMYGSLLDGKGVYFNLLSENIKNTEFINKSVPGFDILQEIMMYDIEGLGEDTDLLIEHFWEDDGSIYKYINGVLYDSKISTNNIGDPYLFNFIPSYVNSFLIKKSYLYNILLKIKIKNQLKNIEINSIDYIVSKLDDMYNKYLSDNPDKHVLILFSPSLSNNSYLGNGWTSDGYPELYDKIEKKFKENKRIRIIYLDTFFTGVDVGDIRIDNICHFNEYGHKIIADKLLKFIKNNSMLNEKCY